MNDYKSRLRAEELQLRQRLEKLQLFMGTKKFDDLDATDQELLRDQERVMRPYKSILEERISRV
jgi:hypothetical protein